MKTKYRLASFVALTLAFAGCGRAASSAPGAHGTVVPAAASLARYQPREDGWQNYPAHQPHPGDPNPLRRALGDGPIYHKLFGKPATALYLGCVKQRSGSQCGALQQDLLQRVRSAGFSDATIDDVLDPHILH